MQVFANQLLIDWISHGLLNCRELNHLALGVLSKRKRTWIILLYLALEGVEEGRHVDVELST